jgi:hypothetical protein
LIHVVGTSKGWQALPLRTARVLVQSGVIRRLPADGTACGRYRVVVCSLPPGSRAERYKQRLEVFLGLI